MSYFEENIKIIKQRDIVLYEQLQLWQDHLVDRVEAAAAKNGDSYLKVCLHGQWVAFNSTYSPLKEAESFAKKYEQVPPYGRLLFLGFGNGYFCRALINKAKKEYGELEEGARVKFAFYEPDSQIFLYVMQTYDLTDLLSNEDVFIFVEGMNDNLLSGWCNRNLDIVNEKAFFLDALPKYAEQYADAFGRLHSIYDRAMETLCMYANTKKQFGRQSARNGIYNLAYEQNSDNFSALAERYPETLPFVIVSSGPSLEKSLGVLSALSGKAFIMAMDSAAGYLIQHGVQPDGIVSMDPIKSPAFFSEAMRDIPFFVHTELNHEVLDLVHPKHIYFISSYLDYEKILAEERGDEIPELDVGGSVATLAFALAVYLKTQQVIFIGQDLCVTKEASHIVDVLENRSATEHACIEVPGNLEETVYTYSDLYCFLEWFQEKIQEHREIFVINATVGGARIEGAHYMYLEEAVSYAKGLKGADDYMRFIETLSESRGHAQGRTRDFYSGVRQRLAEIKTRLRQGCMILEECGKLQGMDSPDAMQDIVGRLGRLQMELCGIPEFELVEHASVDTADTFLSEMGMVAPDKRDSVKKLMEIYKKYFMCLLEEVAIVDTWCEEAVSRREAI